MNKKTAKRLDQLFEEMDAEFPDKSTAFLLEITAERARIMGIKKNCDCADVADALFQNLPKNHE